MTGEPRSLEGRKWKKLFYDATGKLFRKKQIIYNAQVNFGLETCKECEELKKIDEPCKECGKC